MVETDYPILLFPAPARADRTTRPGFGGGLKRPSVQRQGKRLARQFQRLQDALENRRLALQDTALGIKPEMTLVLETVGPIENLFQAVQRVEGLEWLGGHDIQDIPPGEGFENPRDREKHLSRRLFLVMSDHRALANLRGLFESWRRDPDEPFPHGLAPLKQAFGCLREVRPWDEKDRLEETGLLENWRERVKTGQETLPFEAELWYRGNESRRREGAQRLRHLVRELGGEVVTECVIQNIAYHGVLGHIDITRVEGLLDHPAVHGELALFQCDDVTFFRPVGQCLTPIPQETGATIPALPPDSGRPREAAPVVALLDGLPLTNHALLRGRLKVDDPDEYEDRYQARERSHGTAMASLICHGDLDAGGASLGRPIYVRPIMRPRRGFAGNFVESIPERVLPVDFMHRAVVRLFEGEGDEPPVAPEIRVVNLSIGDPARPLIRDMSAWARLLDWLSWKYNILFVVSAGNHRRHISFDERAAGLRGVRLAALQKAVISAMTADTRHRRLLSPAETLNGLTVGAVHEDKSDPAPGRLVDPLEPGLPSVFSAHGPGHRRAIKPDILLPGGRQVQSEHPLPPGGKVVLRPHTSPRPPGQRVATPGTSGAVNATHYTRGTSNAAALASREACVFYELLETLRGGSDRIPREFDAVLLKTLLVHGAEWGHAFETYKGILGSDRGNQAFRDHVARFLGYGRPNFERVATGTDRRVTVLGFGSLEDGEAAKFALPLPPSLSGVRVKRRLTVTLAWFSPINSSHRKYRAAHLWFETPEPGAGKRPCASADWQAARRGTVQHEMFETKDAVVIEDGGKMIVKVNCRKDAGDIDRAVRLGLAVTLEIAVPLLLSIPVYEEVRQRIAVRVQGPA